MLKTTNTKRYFYQAFGLKIVSEIELPTLLEISPVDDSPVCVDITIQYGEVPETLFDTNKKGRFSEMKMGEFLFSMPQVARYFVKDGSSIIVQPLSGTGKEIVLHLTCTVFGALFHQRGLLALHSSVVKVGGFCAAFCGESGAGKSTLAKSLLNRGYIMQSDDLGVIWPEHCNADGVPMLYPSFPYMKLWLESLHHSGEDESSLRRIKPECNKYSFPVNDQFNGDPLPVGKIYVLSYGDVEEPQLIPIQGIHKMKMLRLQTYRFRLLIGLECQENHFKAVSTLANKVDVVKLVRPRGFEYMDRIVDYLETHFKTWA